MPNFAALDEIPTRERWMPLRASAVANAVANARCVKRRPASCVRGPDPHGVPFARAGEHTADNIVLLCSAHNALRAERDDGREFVQARITRASRPIAVAQS